MLALRVLSGVVAVPILLYLASDNGWPFRLGLLACGLLGTIEAVGMARQSGLHPSFGVALLLATAIILDVSWPWVKGQLLFAALGIAAVAALVLQIFRADLDHALVDWALTLALPLYVAGLVAFFAPLRDLSKVWPFTWPALVMVTSWSCDIAAYFGGRRFGRTRLAPLISPSKTREGALFGIFAATIVGMALSLANGVDPLRMAGFGVTVGAASVLGDLSESFLKRQFGVKDSGILIPGHGGILDRMDALIFSAAGAYFYLQVVS